MHQQLQNKTNPKDKNRINSYTHPKRSRWDLEFTLKLRSLSPAKPLGPWRKNYLQLATKTQVVLAVGSAPLSRHVGSAQSISHRTLTAQWPFSCLWSYNRFHSSRMYTRHSHGEKVKASLWNSWSSSLPLTSPAHVFRQSIPKQCIRLLTLLEAPIIWFLDYANTYVEKAK